MCCLIDFLEDLGVHVRGVLRSPTIIVLHQFLPLYILVFVLPIKGAYMLVSVISFDHYIAIFFLPCYSFCFKVYFVWSGASLIVQLAPAMEEIPVQFLGWEDPLEKG